MRVIDCDTHVDETEDTWAWMEPGEEAFKPTTAFPSNPDPARQPSRYWMIDGHRQPRFVRDDKFTGTTVETRELLDPEARVRHMDELGTEVQVLYPTLFLIGITEKPELELALKRSYNRWLADRTERTGGRLRWVCLPPLTDIPRAIEEVRFAKAHGACAVLKKGDREAGAWLSDEYFYPFYEECERLDLPICFHIGSGTPDFTPSREFRASSFMKIGVPPMNAFMTLVRFAIPHRFPGLRWGFIETGSSWVPYAVYDVLRSRERLRRERPAQDYVYEQPADVVRLNQFYITCQVDEDLPYIMQYTGEDHLLVGSDYSHPDASLELSFAQILQQRANRGDIPQSAVQAIAHDNGKTFYGL
jgi:predicted TIM-barrel fold metal-dependent hydrolase